MWSWFLRNVAGTATWRPFYQPGRGFVEYGEDVETVETIGTHETRLLEVLGVAFGLNFHPSCSFHLLLGILLL
jgi:hypothetical protein